MKTGIVSSYYLSRYGLSEGASRMKQHGYTYADYQDFLNTETEFFKLSEKEFEEKIKDTKAKVNAEGIFYSQAHGAWRYPPRDLEKADREERFASMCKGLRGTAYLECPNFVIHPIMPYGANSDENPEETVQINYEFMGRLAEYGRQCGVTVCLENMPFPKHPITTVKHVVDFAKKINSDYFKVCIDTGHSLVCNENIADAVKYAGKDLLATLHVHDNDGLQDRHLRPFEGILDFKGFSSALHEIGFEGAFSLETSPKVSSDPSKTERNELALAELALKLANNNF